MALGGRDSTWGQREGRGVQEERWGCSSGARPRGKAWRKGGTERRLWARGQRGSLGTPGGGSRARHSSQPGSAGHAVATLASREPRSARWQEAPAMPCSPGFLLGSEGVISARIAEEARAAPLPFLHNLPCKWHIPEGHPAC